MRCTITAMQRLGGCAAAPRPQSMTALMTQEQEDSTRWLEIIKDYADIQELDAVTLNRLIQKIVIHEDIDGETVRQTVEIHFNFNDKADKRRIIREK